MNILFFNTNLYGHINPTLGLVKHLQQRGHNVRYCCAEPFADKVLETGAEWMGYNERLSEFLSKYKPSGQHPFYTLLEYILAYDEVILPQLLELTKAYSPDMIMCDSYFGAGCFLKQLVNIPVVCSHSSFALSKMPLPDQMMVQGFHPQLDACYQILQHICDAYHLPKMTLAEVFLSKGDSNVVYTTPSFNGDISIQESEYLFVGPSTDREQEGEAFPLPEPGDGKVLYIAMGSINNNVSQFYRMCMDAVKDMDIKVYIAIGKKCDVASLGEIPNNCVVKSFLPQLTILKRADAFITHAGFNSVSEALWNGVPMMAVPQINDQILVAKRVVALHLGVSAKTEELTAASIRENVQLLLQDTTIKDNCQKMSEEMHRDAKMEDAISALERVVSQWKGRGADGIKE